MYKRQGLRYVQGVAGVEGYTTVEYAESGGVPCLTYTKQVDADTYAVLCVADPLHRNTVYGDGVIDTYLVDYWEDDDNQNFIIPLRRDLVKQMPPAEQEQLHYVALMLVFHAYERTKLSWYETDVFKAFIIMVSVVVMIYSGYDIFTNAATTLTAQGATAAAIYLATVVLASIAIQVTVKYVVQVVGPKVAFLAAVLAVIAGLVTGFTDTSLFNIDPTTLVTVGTSIGEGVTSNLTESIQSAMTAFNEEYDLLKDVVNSLEELLGTTTLVNPYSFIDQTHLLNFSESATDYYERALLTNPGVLSYDLLTSYVDTQLQLPTL